MEAFKELGGLGLKDLRTRASAAGVPEEDMVGIEDPNDIIMLVAKKLEEEGAESPES